MLDCQNLTYQLNRQSIIKNFSFSLNQGKHILIKGASGSGKTTLLCLLAGLIKASSGKIIYDKQEITTLTAAKLDKFRAKSLGFVFQNFHLIKYLTIKQNLALVGTMSGVKILDDEIQQYLTELGLAEKANELVDTLSIGQIQRLAVIRSVISKANWILCDEPTSALDDDNTNKLCSFLKIQAAKNNSSLIIVSHDNRVEKYFQHIQILTL